MPPRAKLLGVHVHLAEREIFRRARMAFAAGLHQMGLVDG